MVPKYEEFVAPHVDLYVVPNYNKELIWKNTFFYNLEHFQTIPKFVKPHVDNGIATWNAKVQPVIIQNLNLLSAKYTELIDPHVQKVPFFSNEI